LPGSVQTWRWPTDERPGRLKPTEYSSPKPWASASIVGDEAGPRFFCVT